MAFNNILQVIKAIKESTLNKSYIQLNVALSLLEKDLYHLALSLDKYGISYIPKSSTNRFSSWCQSICCGERRLFKVLKLNKDKLTTFIEINTNTKLQVPEQHCVSIGCKDSPQKMNRLRNTDTGFSNISCQENDKLNYLSSILSSTELIGMPTNHFYWIVIPKLRYQYRKTTLQEEDLLRMREARQQLIQLSVSDKVPITTRASKKMKLSTNQEKLDSADATTNMINFSAKFIMRNSDREKHLFFIVDCTGYNIWVHQMTTGTGDQQNHKLIQDCFLWGYHTSHLLKKPDVYASPSVLVIIIPSCLL